MTPTLILRSAKRVSKDEAAAQRTSWFEEPRHSASKTRVCALTARLLTMRTETLQVPQ
jgi:hypothetical protein